MHRQRRDDHAVPDPNSLFRTSGVLNIATLHSREASDGNLEVGSNSAFKPLIKPFVDLLGQAKGYRPGTHSERVQED